MEDPLQSRGAFTDASRLYVLQGALAQQEWRAGNLLHRLVAFLMPFCAHPYQTVRDRLGSVLTNVFLNDLEFDDKEEASNKRNPRVADFLNEVLPKLDLLATEPDPSLLQAAAKARMATVNGPSDGPNRPPMMMAAGMTSKMPPRMPLQPIMPGVPPMGMRPVDPQVLARMAVPPPEMMAKMPTHEQLLANMIPPEMLAKLPGPPTAEILAGFLPPPGAGPMPLPSEALNGDVDILAVVGEKSAEYEKRQSAIRLLHTVCKLLAGSVLRAFNPVKKEFFRLMPVLCMNESSEMEPHLARDCTVALACLAQALIPETSMISFLEAVEGVANGSTSWKARGAAMGVLGVSQLRNELWTVWKVFKKPLSYIEMMTC